MTFSTPERITVIGTGYLGATHAVCMAELGFAVLGVDIDANKVAALSAGEASFYEPGLNPLLRKHVESGRLRFTRSYGEAAAFGDVHFICVGTPQQVDRDAADLSYLETAFTSLAREITRPCLIVGKSTVPVGTAERIEAVVAQQAPLAAVAWNPEFLREGFAVEDTLHPDRLVFGVRLPEAERTLRAVYEPIIKEGCPVIVTDFATAQLAKGAANAFLATKISFINSVAEVCDATGADVTQLADTIGYDQRIGRRFLNAGLGFGGGCLPKDLRAFAARAEELGLDGPVQILRQVDQINQWCRARTIKLVTELAGEPLQGKTIAVLGAAFKPNSDDIRDSPALEVAVAIYNAGARVKVYDPEATATARRNYPHLEYMNGTRDAARGADVVLLATEWAEFRALNPASLNQVVRHRNVMDARNVLDPAAWRAAGWTYRGLGRP